MQGMWHYMNGSKEGTEMINALINYPTVCSVFDKGYRYGFNGKERDNDIAGKGNINTAEYWEYDTRLGRRWNLDPVDQIWMSNYSVLNNNPICFIDPFGDKFKPGYSKRQYRKQKRYTKSLIRYYNNEVIRINKNIAFDRENVDDIKILEEYENENNMQLEIFKITLNELNNALIELEIMNNDQINTFIIEEKESKNNESNGKTYRNSEGIEIQWNGLDRAVLGHELKHGFQSLTCEVDVNLDGSADAYDINDEVEAYKRQIAYTPGRTITYTENGEEKPITYKNLDSENVRKIIPEEYKDLPEEKLNKN